MRPTSSPTRRRCRSRDASLDLVVSALALQFVNDLPGALIQIRRALKPDGLFLAALLGGDTLTELRQSFAAAEAEIEGGVSPRVAPFADVREMGALLQRAGFALPVADVERLTVRYSSPFILMGELRRMGATNVLAERRRTPLRRATLEADGGDLRASVSPIRTERFARPSRSSGSPAGRRTRASRSRCGRAPRRRGSPTRSAPAKSARARSRTARDSVGHLRFVLDSSGYRSPSGVNDRMPRPRYRRGAGYPIW